MSGWLSKATGALRGDSPEEPQPFETLCECGVRHSGLRRRKPQRLVCRSCGTSLFVLPRNVYPTPTAPPPPRPKPRKKRKKPSPPVTQVGQRVFQQATESVAKASAKVGRGAADAGLGFGARVAAFITGFIALWTPFRLIVLGVVVLCAITAAVTLLSDRSETAVIALTSANENARTAMEAGDFVLAQSEFTRAVALLDELKRQDDPLAREIRQLHRETSAIRDIVAIPLLDIVMEADAALESRATAEWERTFQTRYRDRWLVLEGSVVPADRAISGGRYAMRIPIGIGPSQRSVSVEAALQPLDGLVKGRPRPVILAGQIESCALSSDRRTWVVRLARSSAFLWTNAANYQALGFTFDHPETEQQVRAVLAGQAQLLELPPEQQP